MLTYETTHEYYLGEKTCLHYCAEHGTLIVTPDHCDRVLLTGIDKSTMLDFARNRWYIHSYEVKVLWDQHVNIYNKVKPVVMNAVDTIKSLSK